MSAHTFVEITSDNGYSLHEKFIFKDGAFIPRIGEKYIDSEKNNVWVVKSVTTKYETNQCYVHIVVT
jgi:hypothetical protein